MSVFTALTRRLQTLTTDAKPDPPRVIIQGPEPSLDLPSAEIKQKSAPVTPDPNRSGAIIPVARRHSSTTNPSTKPPEFSDPNNFSFPTGQPKTESKPRSPYNKTKPRYKSSQSPHVVNYNIVNSTGVKIGSKTSYICNINQSTGNVHGSSDASFRKEKNKPMPVHVEELSCCKDIINLDDMFTVKTHLGYGWRDVARRLGYSEGQIQQFEENHKYIDQVVYQILLDWKQTKTKDAQVGILISTIWLSQEYDCAERLAASHKNST